MRQIQKKNEPKRLTEWRIRYKAGPNFNYKLMRGDAAVTREVEESLLDEQGALCAYTGRAIDKDAFHVEHLKPQTHCGKGEDVDYKNMVACYPSSKATVEAPYGAHQKKSFPSPAETHLFVSPLDANCESRFRFSYSGKVAPKNDGDEAASTTIEKLKLNHLDLVKMRKAAIQGLLQPRGEMLNKHKARRVLSKFQQHSSGKLQEFQFVLVQVLINHLKV